MTDWLKAPYEPQETDDATRAFPANIMHLMPDPASIPEDFSSPMNPWREFQALWFFSGLSDDVKFYAKPGVDPEVAFHHLLCIQRSYMPSHQDKAASVAFLASLWFEKIEGDGVTIVSDERVHD